MTNRISRGPLCRRVAIGVFASIQKTTPTCHCFHCHMRRSRWSWVSPGGTRVSLSHQPSRGPSSVWFVGTLARAATASCCSFVSTIADSVACSILATVLLSSFVFRLIAPVSSFVSFRFSIIFIFQTFIPRNSRSTRFE